MPFASINLLSNALIPYWRGTRGTVTLASVVVGDLAVGTCEGGADTGATLPVEYLRRDTVPGGAAVAATNGNRNRYEGPCNGLSLPNGCFAWNPVAEVLVVLGVGAGFGFFAPDLVPDVATLLAAALQVVQVADGAVAPPPPAPIDKLVDEHAAGHPPGLAGDAGWVLAEQVVAGVPVDGWPVEHVGTSEQFL